MIVADPDRIQQLLWNLLTNAASSRRAAVS
jgi:signal transduction histidine kinase